MKYKTHNDSIIYIVSIQHWTRVLQSKPDLKFSPVICIGYDTDHAQLVLIDYYFVHFLDVTTWEWKKIQDTDMVCSNYMNYLSILYSYIVELKQ